MKRQLTMLQVISHLDLDLLDPDTIDRRKEYLKQKIRYKLAEEMTKDIEITEWVGLEGLYIGGVVEDWKGRALAAEAELRLWREFKDLEDEASGFWGWVRGVDE